VLAFTEQHFEQMSREAVRSVVERMPKSEQARVLVNHKRASAR
jgi:hypothetical protein